jgi:DNA-binding NarL/FixJ family response regulator
MAQVSRAGAEQTFSLAPLLKCSYGVTAESRRVAAQVQVLSSHPLFPWAVDELLSQVKGFSVRNLPAAANEAQAMSYGDSPRLFLLDGCSLRTDLGRLAERCRAQAPGSKFLALLPPENCSEKEMLRLFLWGIDGFVVLDKSWQSDLPDAIRSIFKGHIWVPRAVTAAYVTQMRAMLDTQLAPGQGLTAREAQVLQLLMRRLANKEISRALAISERTVKFHVSNILSKLHLGDRRSLRPDTVTLRALPS